MQKLVKTKEGQELCDSSVPLLWRPQLSRYQGGLFYAGNAFIHSTLQDFQRRQPLQTEHEKSCITSTTSD